MSARDDGGDTGVRAASAVDRRSILRWGAAGAGAALLPAQSWGQSAELPEGNISIVIPGATGGASDIIGRLIGDRMGAMLGRTVLIDPKPGAGGLVAGQHVARAKPDGMTLLFVTGGHTILPGMLRKTTTFEAVNDFSFVSTIAIANFILAVRPDHPAKTFQELLDISKKEPGSQTYTSIGSGSTHQLIGELTQRTFGVKWVEVPYKGGQAAMTDVLGGRVSISLDAAGTTLGMINSGQLRPLAVTQKPRMTQLPNVPAISEFPPGVDTGSYYGLAAAAKTPPAIIDRLNKAVVAAVANPDVQKALENIGSTPQSSTPQEFTARIAGDVARWTKLITELDIQAP